MKFNHSNKTYVVNTHKSYVELTLTLRLRLLAFGHFSLSFFSNPSKVKLASTGDAGPPGGVPLWVGLRMSSSINPAFSHWWSMSYACSTFTCPHAHRPIFRFALLPCGEVPTYHVSLTCPWTG